MDSGADQCTIGGQAWIILEDTGEAAKCNGYLKGKNAVEGPILPIVSGITCVEVEGEESFLMIIHHACYHDDVEQDESLILPYQAMEHGVKFDLTPRERLGVNNETGTQRMIIDEREIPLIFDGRKAYLNIRRPSVTDLEELETMELTSPIGFNPEEDNPRQVEIRRKHYLKKFKKYPGGLSMEEWRNRLALAPDDVIRKTFQATTQMAPTVEVENRLIPRQHHKSRFPFLKEKRLNDEFHSDTFFPTVKSNQGHTCSQIFLGKNTDYMSVYPMKRESHSFVALQDFGRTIGLPRGIKTDNAKTEVGSKWTGWCRHYCVDTKFTEPRHPWQNMAERGIGDLGRMVKRCIRKFGAPLSRHAWCQKWCCDVRNHLASRKLKWRTPKEKLTGETPDLSPFRFHFWEKIEYYDPDIKQPEDGWLPGRFLGIDWASGDALTFFIETEKPGGGRNMVLTRSNVRPRKSSLYIENPDSGETIRQIASMNGEYEESESDNGLDITFDNKKTEGNAEIEEALPTITLDLGEKEDNDYGDHGDDDDDHGDDDDDYGDSPGPTGKVNIDGDDFFNPRETDMGEDDFFTSEDTSLIDGEIETLVNGTEEDFEFNRIKSHRWEDGMLIFEVELNSGKSFEVPFTLLKKDRPLETAKYIRREVVEKKRGGIHEMWAKTTIKAAESTIRRLRRFYNIDRLYRTKTIRNGCIRRISRNKRNDKNKKKVKYGIRVPSNVKEALKFDKENGNNLWGEAIAKELGALDEAGVFEYQPPHFQIDRKEYQYTPLRIIFDVKAEDLRHKARMVAGGHVVNATMYESYASVVQTRTIRILKTIAANEGLNFITGDIGNAFVQAQTQEKIYSKAGPEFGPRSGCIVILKKALYGLSTSARAWNLELGDSIRRMGYTPTRADPDLWIKKNEDGKYEYIATYVDDLIMVSKDPTKDIEFIRRKYPIRNIEHNPEYYLGNDIQVRDDKTIKVSNQKYITEMLRKYEKEYGEIRKEKTPMTAGDHPELDDSPLLNEDQITHYQSIIGTLQWIVTSGRLDITFAVASLSRFNANPREGHLRRTIKILGYLKKYPKKGYIVDPKDPILNFNYTDVEPDFGNQYSDFVEEIDNRLPEPKMKELPITIFVDSDHGHDRVTGKSITGVIVFVGRTPIYWGAKRQSSVQTSTFGAEFIALKKAVEEAVTTRYHLRSMGVHVSKPAVIYADNMSSIINATEPGSQLKKKYLALSYHFCREHFSASIVNIRKIDGKHNYADPFTKSLSSPEFHEHFNQITEN